MSASDTLLLLIDRSVNIVRYRLRDLRQAMRFSGIAGAVDNVRRGDAWAKIAQQRGKRKQRHYYPTDPLNPPFTSLLGKVLFGSPGCVVIRRAHGRAVSPS